MAIPIVCKIHFTIKNIKKMQNLLTMQQIVVILQITTIQKQKVVGVSMKEVISIQPQTTKVIAKIVARRLEKGIKDSKSRVVAEAVALLAEKELGGNK